MPEEADFTAYAAARWQRVVRTLVLLGVPPGHAAEFAGRAFAQCRYEWDHHDAFDELDAELFRIVLECKERDRSTWWDEPPFDDEVWAEVEPLLDRLPPDQRTALLLEHVAGLPEAHVAAVLGRRVTRVSAPTDEELVEVAAAVPVTPPDLDRIVAVAAARRQRHQQRLASAAIWGAIVLVLAVVVVAVLLIV